MTQLNEIYNCAVCGNMVGVIHAGDGELECCGKPMRFLVENSVDASFEKHVPVIQKIKDGFRVQVGSEKHPMTQEHHIEWIEIIADGKVYRKYLKPGDEPVAEFCVAGVEIIVRAYCNLHGLWGAKLQSL